MLKLQIRNYKRGINSADIVRRIFLSCILLLLIPGLCFSSTTIPYTEATVSMDFKDISLKDFMKIFSMQTGMNFIASQAVQDRKITLYLDKVPVKEATEQIFKANNLTYEYDEISNIILIKDWGVPGIETITKVFPLKYAQVSTSSLQADTYNYIVQGKGDIQPAQQGAGGGGAGGGATTGGAAGGASEGKGRWKSEEKAGITFAIKELLSENGKLIEEARTNSLIITDIPSRFPIIEAVIRQLDVPQAQILLEVEILDVSKNAIDNIGMKFGQTPLDITFTGATTDIGFPFKSWMKTFPTTSTGTMTVEPGTGFELLFEYLTSLTDTKYLARPRILTLNNETAEIKIATNEVIGEVITYDPETGQEQSRTAERTETGVSLRVTPQVNPLTGEITMFVFPRVIEASTSSFSEAYRDPEARGAKSVIKVRDGETIIIGGLIRNQRNETTTKLPLLGDIPLLGKLLTHKEKNKDIERELVIFITPRILKDTKTKLAGIPKNVKVEREQDSIVTSERLSSIDAALDRLEKKKIK